MRSVNWLKVLLVAAVVGAGLIAWQVVMAPEPEDDSVVIESAEPREVPLRRVPERPVRKTNPPIDRTTVEKTTRVSATAVVDLRAQPPAPATVEPTPQTPAGERLQEAWRALERLKQHLGARRSINEEILYALEEVSVFYLRPPPNERRLILELDLEKVANEEEWTEAHLEAVKKYRRAVETVLRKALVLTIVPQGTERNIRADVNIRTAQILGQTRNPALAKPLQNALEKKILKAKHEVPAQLLDACFESIAAIGTEKSFDWMVKDFTHTKDSPRRELDALVSAHRALVKFENVSGKSRHRVTRELVKSYSGAADDEIWQTIGVGVIQTLQHFTGKPKDEEDVLLHTMDQFREWFRAHKSPKDPVWADE